MLESFDELCIYKGTGRYVRSASKTGSKYSYMYIQFQLVLTEHVNLMFLPLFEK